MDKLSLTTDTAPELGLHVEVIDWDALTIPPDTAPHDVVAEDGTKYRTFPDVQPVDGLPTKILFAPLDVEKVLNVAKFVRDQLDEWGLYFDPAEERAVVESLERERDHERQGVKRSVRVVKADLTQARPAKWAWKHRIYLGGLSLIIGGEGVGKGTQAAWMIARLTQGELDGEFEGQPVNVAIVGTEDSFQSIWVPRVHVADGDLDHLMQLERPDGGVLGLQDDKYGIGRALQENNVKLLYFDSLLDNLGTETNAWYDKGVREALDPARWLADELGIAIVGSLHPNKRGESFSHIVSGARAFNAVSRSTMFLAEHPEKENVKVFLRGKGNYAEAPEAKEWSLVKAEFDYNGHHFDMSKVEDMRPSEVTLDDLLDKFSGEPKHDKKKSKVEEAMDIIRELVPPTGKEVPAHEIITALNDAKLDSKSTQQTARSRLGVESFQRDGAHWWRRPLSASMDPESES